MRLRDVVVLVFVGVMGVMAHSLRAQELPLTHYTPESEINPLPGAAVPLVYQDRIGFLWISVYAEGAVRYDGQAMVRYGTEDGLGALNIWSMDEDAAGRLWVGSDEGLFVSEEPLAAYAEGRRIRFTDHVGDLLLQQAVVNPSDMAVDGPGNMWVAAGRQGLLRYQVSNADSARVDTLAGFGGASVLHVVGRRDGSIWASLSDGRLAALNPSSLRPRLLDAADGGPGSDASVLYESPSGTLWVGNNDGRLWRVDEREGAPRYEAVETGLTNRVTSILEAPPGKLWVTSLAGGLLEIDLAAPEHHRLYTRQNGLLNANVWDVLQDREGNFWIAQNSGLSKMQADYAAFGHFTATSHVGEQPVLPGTDVNVVVPGVTLGTPGEPGSRKVVAAGTADGLAFIAEDGTSETLQEAEGLASNIVLALCHDGESGLWVGGRRTATHIALHGAAPPGPSRRRAATLFGQPIGLASYELGFVNACGTFRLPAAEEADEAVQGVWFAGDPLIVLLEGQWYSFGEAAGIPAGGLWAMAADAAGYVYVVSKEHGIYRSKEAITQAHLAGLDAEVVTASGLVVRRVAAPAFEPFWDVAHGAPTDAAAGLVWADSVMWVGSAEGLAALEGTPPRMTTLVAEELRSKRIQSMAVSPVDGTIWLGTGGGLIAFDPSARRVVRTLTTDDGLVNNQAWGPNSVAATPDGTVYYGTPAGLSLYRPALDRRSTVPPVLVFKQVSLTEDRSGHNALNVAYAALSFANEKRVQYKTRLVGYDEDWSPESGETKIRYTNLPAFLFPRTYAFEVTAASSEGVWAEVPLAYAFTVQPAWWLRWWAFLLYLGLFASIVVSVNKFRTRGLEARSRVLERTVQERTQALRVQAEELESVDEIVRAVNREVRLERVLRIMLDQVMRFFPQAQQGTFLLFDPERAVFRFAAVAGYDRALVEGVVLSREEALGRYTEASEQIEEGVYIVRRSGERAGQRRLQHLPIPRSMLAMAVTLEGRLEGFLILDNLYDADAFDASDLKKLARFREHTISAIAKAEMLNGLEDKNQALVRTQQQLIVQEKLASLGQLTAGIAHEIKNPLNFINNFADLSRELVGELHAALEAGDAREVDAILADLRLNAEKIEEHGRRADGIVQSMMQHARGAAALREAVDLNALVAEYVELAYHGKRAQVPGFKVAIERDLDAAVGTVDVVPQEIGRVVLNLLSNAFDAVSEQAATPEAPCAPCVHVSTQRKGGSVTIRVADNGPGIPPAVRERIFEPFFTTKPTGSGTGLGLSLSYDIVTSGHGGTFVVESEEGRGAAFVVTLPAALPGSS